MPQGKFSNLQITKRPVVSLRRHDNMMIRMSSRHVHLVFPCWPFLQIKKLNESKKSFSNTKLEKTIAILHNVKILSMFKSMTDQFNNRLVMMTSRLLILV